MIWIDLSVPHLPVRLLASQDAWPEVHFGEFVAALNCDEDRSKMRDDVAQPFEPA